MAVAGAMPMVLAVDDSPLTQLNAELPSGSHSMPIGVLQTLSRRCTLEVASAVVAVTNVQDRASAYALVCPVCVPAPPRCLFTGTDGIPHERFFSETKPLFGCLWTRCAPSRRTRRDATRRERMLSLVAATALVFSAPAVPSILVADGLAPSAMKLLQQSGAKVVDRHLSNAELSGGGLQDFDAVIVRSATMLSAAAIRDGAAGRLRVIGRAGVGVDNIDVAAALEHGCWVVNTPGASTASVVELTLAHMLAAARGLQVADQGLKTGRWLKGKIKLGVDDGPRVGHELRGKRLGLLGFGRIAQGVARAASALGMVVHAYSRHAQPEVAASLGVILEPSEADLFAKCARSRRRLSHSGAFDGPLMASDGLCWPLLASGLPPSSGAHTWPCFAL